MANVLTPFPRVFMSHSTKDNDFGLRLARDLRQIIGNDDAVWFDALGGLQGGDIWWSKIVEELTNRDVFLIVLSPDAMTSEWVLRELNMAIAEKKRIVPLLYKPCTIRADLKTIQYISFLSPKAYEDAFNELLAVLMGNSPFSQQVPTTDTMLAFPSRQLSGPPNAAASFPPPTEVLSATSLAEPFSASNLSNSENIPPLPKTRRNSAIASHGQGFHISRTVLLIGLVLLVIVSGVGIFAVSHANQLATFHATATATARANATATASATNPYEGALILNDPLQNNRLGYVWAEQVGSCQFVQGTYHVSAPAYVNIGCPASPDFSNFAFEVQMTIIKGDSGGITFRLVNQTRYIFHVDEDGQYDLVRIGPTDSQTLIYPVLSLAVHRGLGQTNLIAVVAQGSRITLYVNRQQINSVTDSSFSHGRIAVVAYANNGHATEVAYSNARVWSLPTSGSTIMSILHGAVATPPSQVNLTSEGTSDWIHWGLYTGSTVDRKNEVPPQISTFRTIGNATAMAFNNNNVAYSWSDGTPDRTIANTTTGVLVNGVNNGFSFSVPASTTTHTLRVHVDVWLSQGKFTASLTDGSGLVYTDASLNNTGGVTQAVYTLTYRSSSHGQQLTITFVEVNAYYSLANVALAAATLQ